MSIAVDIKGVDMITVAFCEKLKQTFCVNLLCVKWEKKDIFYVILNLFDCLIDSIKSMFYKPTSDDFLKHRMNLNVFLILDTDTLVCSRNKLGKVLDLLHTNIRVHTYRMAFMRFDLSSIGFIPEIKNKNDDEKNIYFSSELEHLILSCETSTGINNSPVCDKIVIKADSSTGLSVNECRRRKHCSKNKTSPPRISQQTFQSPSHISNHTFQVYQVCPYHSEKGDNPPLPNYNDANRNTGTNSQISAHRDHNIGLSLQESIANMVQYPNQIVDQDDARHGLQSLSLMDDLHSHDVTSINSENNPIPMEYQVYSQMPIQGQSVSHDGTSSTGLEVGDSRSVSFHHGVITSYNASASSPDFRFPPPAEVQQRRPFRFGLLGGDPSAHHQQYQQQHRESTSIHLARPQAVPQQQNRNNGLLHALGHVRSPEYADLTLRLDTFSRWPSDIAQTPDRVAEAGFYYTGFQDIVRCFACDGGLKNWDPEDDPWIEHARWFPQCAYVRHVKGEEFTNLVRMSSEESDEEDDYTVHRGATWGGATNANSNPDSVSNEIKEPSVLESKDAQFVIEMGFSKKDVAMAINDIFKKGKQDFTGQEIVDIMLEKEMRGELSNYKLSANCPPSLGNTSATEQVMSENNHLKELLQCTECKTKQRNILFLPCTHHVVCESCSRDLHICTCCFRKIKEKVRTYMS